MQLYLTVRQVLGLAALLLALLLLAAGGTAVGLVAAYEQAPYIFPGVSIYGIDVGGLGPAEARAYLESYLHEVVGRPVVLTDGERSWRIMPLESGLAPDVEGMVRAAYAVGRAGNLVTRVNDRFQALRYGIDIPLRVTVQPDQLDRVLEAVAAEVDRPPRNAALSITPDDRVQLTPSQEGRRLDVAATRQAVLAVLPERGRRALPLRGASQPPEVSTQQLAALGIRHLVASFSTTFDPTVENRVTNIRLSAAALDGVLLAPGEALSFNRTVGPRIAAAGYREAPVIVNGQLVPDIGGGVCQVSSTLYNAVVMAGLAVERRFAHSLPATYVPLGRDATVAYDYIDFRFRNSTPHHVLIKTEVGREKVTIKLFGGVELPGQVELVTQIDEVIPPGVEEVVDPSLAPGRRQVEAPGQEGYRVSVWRVVRDGAREMERQLVSRSVYPARARVVRVGAPAVPRRGEVAQGAAGS